MRPVLCVLCLLLLIGAAFAQSDRGTITGTISDPTGAMIGGATVVAKNTQTGTDYQAASTGTGNFTLAQLPIGTYELSVTATGFKKYARPGIIVSVAQVVRVDVKLEVGQITELVTVEAESPLLKTESGELSHNISYDRVDSIPLLTLGGGAGLMGNIRNPLQIVTLLPGASFASENTLRINGMPSSSQAIRIEGQDATNGLWRQINQTNQAGVDAIQEVSVQTSNFSAEYGQAGGGYFNYTMKSGTNRIHGSVYDYNVNEAYNSGTPNTDDGTGKHQKGVQRRNDYGFTFGGPVYIPKLYDGRDKTFFFFTFEQFREAQVIVPTTRQTVPIPAYKAGDFRQALGPQLTVGGAAVVDPFGRPVYQNQIYNPFKTYLGPNNEVMRDPVMGCSGTEAERNVICTNPGSPNYIPLDPVALKIQSLMPDPLGPFSGDLINNYSTPAYQNWRHTTIPSVKIDHNLSAKVKLSGYFSATIGNSPNANGFETFEWTGVTPMVNRSYTTRLNYDHTLKPTLLFHVGIGLMYTNAPSPPKDYDQSKLGFKYNFAAPMFPAIGVTTGAGQKGGNGLTIGAGWPTKWSKDIKPTANTNLTWVKGNHTIKAGGELVLEGLPVLNYSRAGGNYSFAAEQSALPWETGRGFNSTTGFTYASFLMGLTSGLAYSQVTDTRLGNHSLGMYIQDTWKITRRLTMDYGLRYDLMSLLREQYGRMQNADFGRPNPLVVPAGSTQGLPGKMIYEATCNCRFGQTYKFAFGPRLGVAYQINNKTVFRAGAGISYGSSPNNAYLSLSVADWYTRSPSGYGYPATLLKDGNPEPNLVWPDFTDHYPAETLPGVRPPVTPFISIANNTGRPPRIFQWSIGLQREIARNLVLEANYVGNRGAWWTAPLMATDNYNALTPEGLKSMRKYGNTTGLDVTVAADRNLLNTPISNPNVIARFPQLANPNAVYQGFPASQPLRQALRPHPQWFGIPPFLGPPLGDTWYDSLQAKLTKRFSHGLDLQAAFTWQKELTLGVNSDTSYLTPNPPLINDVFDRMSNKQISSFSKPFMLVISFNYMTPKAFAGFNRALSYIVRDWSLAGVLRYQSGDVIRVPSSNGGLLYAMARGYDNNPALWGGAATFWNRVPGEPLLLVDPNNRNWDPTKQLVLNPKAWVEPAPGTFSNSAPYYNNYRWQRQPSESLSFGRNFQILPEPKNVVFSVRIEFQNIFNRMFLSAPSATNPGAFTTYYGSGALSGGYGFVNTVGGAGARPRSGQIVARIQF
jgi:hypothetical protein